MIIKCICFIAIKLGSVGHGDGNGISIVVRRVVRAGNGGVNRVGGGGSRTVARDGIER